MSCNGKVLKSNVSGDIIVKPKLSGNPTIRMGLNNKNLFANSSNKVSLHPSVDLNLYETTSEIVCSPPDEDFSLVTYNLALNVKPCFNVRVEICIFKERKLEMALNLISKIGWIFGASMVKVCIPVPCDVDNPVFDLDDGKATLNYEREVVEWEIEYVGGTAVKYLRMDFDLPSVRIVNKHAFLSRVIEVEFEIAFHTVSNTSLTFLKVEENYEVEPEVMYFTKSGLYQIRMT